MRGAFLAAAAAALWLTPASSAQVSLGNGQAAGISVQWNTPPPPPTPPAPPPPSHGPGGHAQGSSGPVDQFLADQHTYAPRYDRSSQRRGGPRVRRGYVAGFGYSGFAPYDYGYAVPATGPGWVRPPVTDAQGRLALEVTPASTQVLVDGFYIGVVEDFSDRGLWLDPGPRRIELRADGYDTATFDVRIVEGQTVSYQRALARLQPRGGPRQASAVAKKFYVIRGCYAGDTPPDAARLPKGCRAGDVRELPPTLNVIRR